MSNVLKNNQLFGRRALLAIPLSMSLIAFGCTSASSQTAPLPSRPMTSSYSRPETLPTAPRTIRKLTANEAALILMDHRPTVRLLGPVNPAFAGGSPVGMTSAAGSLTNGTAIVSQEGATIVSAPMTARNITPTSTAGRITPASTARSIQPVSNAVNINPTSASAVRIVNDGRGVTVTNQ